MYRDFHSWGFRLVQLLAPFYVPKNHKILFSFSLILSAIVGIAYSKPPSLWSIASSNLCMHTLALTHTLHTLMDLWTYLRRNKNWHCCILGLFTRTCRAIRVLGASWSFTTPCHSSSKKFKLECSQGPCSVLDSGDAKIWENWLLPRSCKIQIFHIFIVWT